MTDAKKPDDWMPFYVDKYLGDTTHLTLEQHAAYLLMLFTAWKRGGALPDDDVQLANITHMGPAKWRKSKAVLRAFFRSDDHGGLIQKRLLAEVERAQQNVELAAMRTHEVNTLRSIAGRKGARSRWQNDGKPDGKPMANAIEDDGKSDGKPIANDMANAIPGMANGMANAWQKGGIPGDSPNPNPSSTASNSAHPPPLTNEDSVRCLPRAHPSAGEACKAMREAGMADVSPSNPTLHTMLEQGITIAELADAARTAIERGKGFSWALMRAAGQRNDAAKVALMSAKKPSPFALPADHVRVLPQDLPDLHMDDENERSEVPHGDDARARG